MSKIPIVYAYVYKKIREKSRTNVIRARLLKQCVVNALCWNRHKHSGVPRCLAYEIIKEMEDFDLIRRLDHTKFRILRSNCESKLKKFFW